MQKQPLTSPFGLEKRLKPVCKNINVFAVINIALIAFGFFILSSKFVLAPGVLIDLPNIGVAEMSSIPVYDVLTVNQQNMILFSGKIFSIDNIAAELTNYHQQNTNNVLLLKIDKNASVEFLLTIFDLATKAGYQNIQIAGIPLVKTP